MSDNNNRGFFDPKKAMEFMNEPGLINEGLPFMRNPIGNPNISAEIEAYLIRELVKMGMPLDKINVDELMEWLETFPIYTEGPYIDEGLEIFPKNKNDTEIDPDKWNSTDKTYNVPVEKLTDNNEGVVRMSKEYWQDLLSAGDSDNWDESVWVIPMKDGTYDIQDGRHRSAVHKFGKHKGIPGADSVRVKNEVFDREMLEGVNEFSRTKQEKADELDQYFRELYRRSMGEN